MKTAKQFIEEIHEEGQRWSDDTEVMGSYFEDYAKLYHESKMKELGFKIISEEPMPTSGQVQLMARELVDWAFFDWFESHFGKYR